MSQTVWPLNENGEIVFSAGTGSGNVTGYLNQDVLPSAGGGIPLVIGGVSQNGNLSHSAGWEDVPFITGAGSVSDVMNQQAQKLLNRTEALRQAIQLADYDALRTYNGSFHSVDVTGYFVSAKPSGIAGRFTLDATDSVSADNNCTVIVDQIGRRWKRQYSGAVNVMWAGAVANGASNPLSSKYAALAEAQVVYPFAQSLSDEIDWCAFVSASLVSGNVFAPSGVYWINKPVVAGASANIAIFGEKPAYLSHADQAKIISNTYSASYTDMPSSQLTGYTVIVCDNCNFAGENDTTTVNATTSLRWLSNVILWGKGVAANFGVYTQGADCHVQDVTAVLFSKFGFISRGQIVSSYRRIGTFDCGWNLGGQGSPGYPNTYYSGCGMILLANKIANDFTTLTPANRPTTIDLEDIYFSVRQHTSANKSGFRGLQAHNLLGCTQRNIGGYTGNLYNVCGDMDLNEYIESYHVHGYVAGDNTPYARSVINSNLSVSGGYANVAGSSNVDSVIDSNLSFIKTALYYQTGYGLSKRKGKPITDTFSSIVTSSASTTSQVTFPNFVQNSEGFNGFVTVALTKKASYSDYRRSFFVTGTHRAGSGVGWIVMPSTQLATQSNLSGGYDAAITLTWSGAALVVSIAWGNLVGIADWDIRVSAFGASALSS